jgi:PAS domain S-box-containing protein
MSASPFRPIDRSEHELLVIDDDPASRYATQRRLISAGFRVREAATGADGLAMADSTVSAIVLDLHLPDIDGFEVCRLLRSNPATCHIPILHLTAAYVTDDDKVRGLDAGADAYLTHPVEPAVLVASVQALVRTRVAEAAMRSSEAKFRGIYLSAPSGISLIHRDGNFLDANPAMLKLLGRPLTEVVGRPVEQFIAPDERDKASALTRPADDPNGPLRLTVLDSAGRQVPLEWHLSAHSDDVVLAQVTDITIRLQGERLKEQSIEREREARASAEHLNRTKDEFIAVLSHELRSPLNAMMGWAHVLRRRGGDELTMKGLDAIERNGKAQARLISDLLDMSQLNMGKMGLTFAPVDLVEVVRTAVSTLSPSLLENENEVRIVAEPPPPFVRGDVERLQQVLWNLLSNAVKFSPRGAPIKVTLVAVNDGVRIDVRDEGRGIAEGFLPHIFERFTQADRANQRNRSGLGLGLSIVQNLVQGHGGTVTARSEGPGKGANFEVWLPISGPKAHAGSVVDDVDPDLSEALHGVRLLVIDDDPEARSILQIILADHGAKLRFAANYEEALQLLAAYKPDAIVCDIGLPGQDGYQLISEVRRREFPGERVPAVALTAFSQAKDSAQAVAAGFDIHLSKPVRPLQLLQTISDLIDRERRRPA